jgi:hypothetical protein
MVIEMEIHNWIKIISYQILLRTIGRGELGAEEIISSHKVNRGKRFEKGENTETGSKRE